MEIREIAAQAVNALVSPIDLSKVRESESTLARAVERQRSGEVEGRDRLSIRMGAIRHELSRLRETHANLRIEQAQKTIAQTVQNTAGAIQGELTEMRRLAEAVAEGGMSEDQVQDVQLMLETRAARIDELAAQARFSGQEVLTGETVRFTTDAITEEGFEVIYSEMDSTALGLGALDVVNQSSETAIGLVEQAAETVVAAETAVASEIEDLDVRLGERVSELQERFGEMRSHELLGAPAETRWRAGDSADSAISAGDLQTALSSIQLDAEVVASVLR